MKPLPTICFLTGTLNAFAGAERMTATVANMLAAQGYRVHILSLWDRQSCFTLDPGIRHHALFASRPSFKREYLGTVLGIRKYLRAHGIEVLIEVDTMLTLFTVPACMGQWVRRIAWEHCHFDEDLGRTARRVARKLAARTNAAIVVLTERDRRRWTEALQPRCAVTVIQNPLPFAYPEHPAPGDTNVVLAVGRLTVAKGFDVLLDAWARIAANFPEWQLQIVGEGEERQALEAQRDALGVAGSVSMPGSTSDIGETYRGASVFCLSSRYEGFGLVLLEAMAYGLPVVSTCCETGPRELLHEDDNALLCTVDDPAGLANALALVMESPAIRARLSRGGRDFASSFAGRQIQETWERILLLAPKSQT